MADDHGRFRATPKYVEGQVFWARETLASVSDLFRELVEAGLVELYTVRGQEYGVLTGWAKHQKVDKPSKPRCPGPNEAETPSKSSIVDDPRETLARPSRGSAEELAPDHDHRPRPTTDDQGPPEDESEPASLPAASEVRPSSSSSDRDDLETPIPLTFALPESAVDELSEHYRQPPEVIREAVRRFRDYWAVGAGTGKRRSHWAKRARDDIRRKHENGELDKIAKALEATPASTAPTVDLAAIHAAADERKRRRLEKIQADLDRSAGGAGA
jgi:hypothetical protein